MKDYLADVSEPLAVLPATVVNSDLTQCLRTLAGPSIDVDIMVDLQACPLKTPPLVLSIALGHLFRVPTAWACCQSH